MDKSGILFSDNPKISPKELVLNKLPVAPLEERPMISTFGTQKTYALDTILFTQLYDYSQPILNLADHHNPYTLKYYQQIQKLLEQLVYVIETGQKINRWVLEEKFQTSNQTIQNQELFIKKPAAQVSQLNIETFSNVDDEVTQIPIACLWGEQSEVWVQYMTKLVRIDLVQKKVLQSINIPTLQMLQYHPKTQEILFWGMTDSQAFCTCDFWRLSTQSGYWTSGLSDDFPLITSGDPQSEERVLVNHQKQLIIPIDYLDDYPIRFMLTPDGQYAGIMDKNLNGGVFELSSGLCLTDTRIIFPVNEDEIEVVWETIQASLPQDIISRIASEDLKEESLIVQDNFEHIHGALTYQQEKLFCYQKGYILINGEVTLYTDDLFSAAAFDQNASSLLLANSAFMTVIPTDELQKPKPKMEFYLFSDMIGLENKD